ncbi:MAG: hypothetical protein HYV24_00905 [Deltaproteobacteria bacterium]|nr:hypothetical protein [Deltaproteobacteria bacterium]
MIRTKRQYLDYGSMRRQSPDWAAGRTNMAFGSAYLLLTMALGLYMNSNAALAHDFMLSQFQRSVLGNALFNSNIDAALNIAVGYMLTRLPFVGWLSRTVSALMIAGAILHSGALYAASFGLLSFGASVAPLGVFIIASVLAIVSFGTVVQRMAK